MIVIILICDRCEAEGIPELNRYGMSLLGWTCEEEDLCPQCSGK